jgi:hypothetical protein
MITRILSEDPTAQNKSFNDCPACHMLGVEISKRVTGWTVACKCGKQSTGSTASQAIDRWNNKKEAV